MSNQGNRNKHRKWKLILRGHDNIKIRVLEHKSAESSAMLTAVMDVRINTMSVRFVCIFIRDHVIHCKKKKHKKGEIFSVKCKSIAVNH